jgi:NADH dehydrogenase/NADH:ubiquinone oxidoreductase subunit G
MKNKGGNKVLEAVEDVVAMNQAASIRKGSKDVVVLTSSEVSRDMLDQVEGRRSGLGSSRVRRVGRGVGAEYVGGRTSLFEGNVSDVSESDRVVRVGVDPRKESPLLNVKLREGFLRGKMRVVSLGNALNLTYPVESIGTSGSERSSIRNGEHEICEALVKAKKPMILVGSSVMLRSDQRGLRRCVEGVASLRKEVGEVVPG